VAVHLRLRHMSGSTSLLRLMVGQSWLPTTRCKYRHSYMVLATGSVHIPALVNGCFGLRPSTGAVSAEGVVSVYTGFDTPALLGRDLERFPHFVRHWYGEGIDDAPMSSPKIIIPTDFITEIKGAQLHLFNSFVKDLDKSLHTVAQRRSIAEEWSVSASVEERDPDAYLHDVCVPSQTIEEGSNKIVGYFA
jgi:hypothetical protein